MLSIQRRTLELGFWRYAILGAVALASGVAQAQPPGDAVFTPLPPCRVVDSRIDVGTTGVLLPGQVRPVTFRGKCGIPGLTTDGGREANQAQALALNLVAVTPSGPGHLTAWASNKSVPLASTLNYSPGETIANGVILPMCDENKTSPCATGDINFQGAVSPVHLVVDVTGYYSKPVQQGTMRIGASSAGGADSFLCVNTVAHIRFGLSTRATEYANASSVCPAGTWLCSRAERGIVTQIPCNTARSDTTCDAVDCAGNCIDSEEANHRGWIQEQAPPLNVGATANEDGVVSINLACELRPAWCCSRDD